MSLPILPPPQGKPKAKRPSNAMPRKAAEAKLRGTAETSELHQQAQVATVLTNHGHCFAAVPNGHVRSVWQNITGALEGVRGPKHRRGPRRVGERPLLKPRAVSRPSPTAWPRML